MRKVVCAALVAACLGVVGSSALARGPYGSIKVGNWTGGGYTNDATGQFNGCTAGATYLDGTYFMVSVSAAGSWSLGFANPSWQLVTGQSFPIDLTFDGQHQFHVFGTPISKSLVTVPMPLNSALINAFRKSQGMAAYTLGKQFQFQLPATSVLLPTLVNCVKQIKENGLASAGDFTIHPAKDCTGCDQCWQHVEAGNQSTATLGVSGRGSAAGVQFFDKGSAPKCSHRGSLRNVSGAGVLWCCLEI